MNSTRRESGIGHRASGIGNLGSWIANPIRPIHGVVSRPRSPLPDSRFPIHDPRSTIHAPRSTPHLRHRRGLTFLEILVVLVIIGIMLAVMLPNMRNPREKAALNSAARQVAAAASIARQQAIATGHRTRLRVDIHKQRFRLVFDRPEARRSSYSRSRDEAASLEERVRPFPVGVRCRRILQYGSEVDLTRIRDDEFFEVVFYPNGSSTGAAIELRNRLEKTVTVEISSSSGRVETYLGPAKTVDEKLAQGSGKGSTPGEGFYRVGSSEDERVSEYKSVVSRILQNQRDQYDMQQQGLDPATYFAQREAERR